MYRGEVANISIFSSLLYSFLICNILIVLRSFIIKKITNKLFGYEHIKAQTCIFKIFFYGFSSIYGYFVLSNEQWAGNVNTYHLTFGPLPYPKKVLFYYLVEFSYYFVEFLYLISTYYNKDRLELLLHHLETISLICLSFLTDYARVGIVVMGLHDVSDPFLESSKLFLYTNKVLFANIGFVIFTFVFITSRIFFYPYWILYPAVLFIKKSLNIETVICGVCLFILYLLHIYWSCMIFKTIKKIFVKRELKDARSESVVTQK